MRVFSIALASLLAAACGGLRYDVHGKPIAAGVDAVIEVRVPRGNTADVRVDLDHLPPPRRVADGAETYVVWFVPVHATPRKAGVLRYDADARHGHLRATCPDREFRVLVTAEPDGHVETPSSAVLVEQTIRME